MKVINDWLLKWYRTSAGHHDVVVATAVPVFADATSVSSRRLLLLDDDMMIDCRMMERYLRNGRKACFSFVSCKMCVLLRSSLDKICGRETCFNCIHFGRRLLLKKVTTVFSLY
jgi:hypothetical protein